MPTVLGNTRFDGIGEALESIEAGAKFSRTAAHHFLLSALPVIVPPAG